MNKKFIADYLTQLRSSLSALNSDDVQSVITVIEKAFRGNQQIFIMGNGGSASLASHFCCDLSKGTLTRIYDHTEKRLRVISLTDNVALLTAFANDTSYDDIFAQQLNNLVNKNDVVIAISGSGNSKNIIKAVDLAHKMGAITVGLLGFDGGKLEDMVNHKIVVPSKNYGVIEDTHSALAHLISASLAKLKNEHE
ncbi:MAG: hypothetical protein A2754_03005 [Candidatus Magasanikbacteria bacterium RIFCSPHIGHO2_01_FULL_47_8]|uniref:SIS domain-containing protein n=1 Tax=Candidatus Magasanikbacteria bacterium RIFCSPHIGHO2_01_FULL_47_8 TaxID=1798673 RepID=A0A1F6MB03_9BACT|nr:MAG: hypothetical protein A2754_03005 [Candidatus Magasanikbacteria bacterium RIFCSPHIGHO2_01_FULL_47_8]